MLTVHELALATEDQFSAFAGTDWKLQSRRFFGEESFKGGFVLEYLASGRRLSLVYADAQFEARLDGREVFGPIEHHSFSGNMFSRENLAKYLSQILRDTVNAMA